MATRFGVQLNLGQELPWDHYLESPNGLFRAELHGDGQLVVKILNTSTRRIEYLYDSATGWAGANARIRMVAQSTGIGSEYIWGAAIVAVSRPEPTILRKLGQLLPGPPNRSSRYAPRLVMQDDGNLVGYPVPGETFGAEATDTVTPLTQLAIPGENQVLVSAGTISVGQGNHTIINSSTDRIVVSDGQTTKVLARDEATPARSSGTISIQTVTWGTDGGDGVCSCNDVTGVVPTDEQIIRV